VRAALVLAILAAAGAAEAQTQPAAQPQTQPQGVPLPTGFGGDNTKPIGIEAQNGIEWQQNNHVYIAHGNATATRGDAKVKADALYAYYRTADAAQPAAAKPTTKPDPLTGSSSTQIYRLEAQGHVVFTNPTETMTGDSAVYDVDTATLVLTGKGLSIVTPRDTITARDSLEWYDQKQLGVARGDAVAVQGDRRVRGDVLTARVTKQGNGPSRISRIDANGNVLVSSPGQIARGDAGVYDLDTATVTLTDHVRLTRGQNELRGRYAVVDLNTNVSRLLSAPPGTKVAGDDRVEGLIMPRAKDEGK
jgi:lipopolysaccharide export system protein LptA